MRIGRAEPGTLAAVALLIHARDAKGRKLLTASALLLLLHYLRDARDARDDGWLCVPPVLTQRERADELDVTDRTVRNLNRQLVAAGFLEQGPKADCGDGTRTHFRRDGGKYEVPLKRRVWWVAPHASALFARANSAMVSRAGNAFPAASSDPQVVPIFGAPSASGMEGAAAAAPVDHVGECAWPTTLPTRAFDGTERPSAAPRGEGAARPLAPFSTGEGVQEGADLDGDTDEDRGDSGRQWDGPEGGKLASRLRTGTAGAKGAASSAAVVPGVASTPTTGAAATAQPRARGAE